MDDTAQSPQPLTQRQGGQPISQAPAAEPAVVSQQPMASVQVGQQSVSQSFVPIEPVAQSRQADTIPVVGKEQDGNVVVEVQPTQPEIVVPQEVQEAGVEASPSEEPQLSQEHTEVGIEAAKEATPVPSGPKVVQLPEDYKAPKGFFSLFGQHVKSAATWLYLLVFKAEQQAARQVAQDKKKV